MLYHTVCRFLSCSSLTPWVIGTNQGTDVTWNFRLDGFLFIMVVTDKTQSQFKNELFAIKHASLG